MPPTRPAEITAEQRSLIEHMRKDRPACFAEYVKASSAPASTRKQFCSSHPYDLDTTGWIYDCDLGFDYQHIVLDLWAEFDGIWYKISAKGEDGGGEGMFQVKGCHLHGSFFQDPRRIMKDEEWRGEMHLWTWKGVEGAFYPMITFISDGDDMVFHITSDAMAHGIAMPWYDNCRYSKVTATPAKG